MTNYYKEHDLLLVQSENLIVIQDSSLLSLSTACMVPVYCPCMMNIMQYNCSSLSQICGYRYLQREQNPGKYLRDSFHALP